MSEIKTVLNFFDKNNGLKTVLKDLKSIKKLQTEINNQKGGVSSDNLKERTAALKEIVRLQKQLDKERKKAISTGKETVGIEKELVKVQEQERRVGKQLKVARTEKFRQLQESKLAQQKQTKAVKAEIIENSRLSSEYERQSAKLNRLRKNLKELILTEGEGSAKTKKLALEVGNLDKKLKGVDAAAGQFQRNVGDYKGSIIEAVKALDSQKRSLKDNLVILDKARKSTSLSAKGQDRVQKEYTETKQKLQQVNIQLNQYNVNAKKSTNVFNKFSSSIKSGFGSLVGALGITAGVAGLVRALGNAVKIAKDFEQGNANLAAVLGKTKDEIGTLTNDAKRLGAATAFSATQVSGLQTEFAKLGFNEQEILNATEATLSLAAATGSDLGEAAAIAGSTLGGFGLGAEETQRVVDVMAKSFSISALDIEKFRESMKNVAPSAKTVGQTLEETTAQLATLSKAGISGSKAGSNLSTGFINLAAKGLTVKDAFAAMAGKEGLEKLNTAVKLVGKNAAKSFVILNDGQEITEEFTKELGNAGGAAEKMAKEQLNTLQGSLTILNSAWEGFVLGILSGDSAFSGFSRTLVEGTTTLLNMLTPAQELADTWFKQRDEVEKLEKEMNPLLDRYDELESQTKLTKDEQIELDNIIQEVAKNVPLAVTEFDKYGKAMGISTKAAREFVEEQKRILVIENAEAIKEQEEAIINLGTAIEKENRGLVRLNGEWVKQTTEYTKNGNAREEIRKISAKELADITATTGALQTDIDTRTAIIAKLKGEKTAKELAVEAAEEASKKAEEEALANQKLIETLESLRAKLKKLKEEREKIDITDKEALKTNKAEIKAVKDLIDKIEGKNKANKKAKDSTEELTEAEKALVAAMEAEFEATDKANKAFEKQSEIDAKTAAELLEAKQKNAEFNKQLSEFSKEFQQDEFDTFIEFQESGFATFKEFEEAKRKELEETEKAKEKADKEEEKRLKEQQKQKEETIKQSKELVDTTIENLTMESEAKIEALDRQLSAEQDFLSQNENLSAREIEFRRKKAAELELQRIEEQKRLEKLAKVQAFFDLVAAFASSGDGQGAVGKAATTMAAAEVISEGFHDGGYTGDGNEYKEAGIVHKGEFVNTKSQTTEYGMKGWESKDFDKAVNDGYFNQFADANIFADQNAKFLSVQSNEIGYDFARLENELKSVKEAIHNSPTTDFEINGEYFIKRTHRKGSTTTKKRKLG